MKIDAIHRGIVLDHIKAGRAMDIYRYLHLDELQCPVAIIKNARSQKMGKKDIIKVNAPSRIWIWISLVLSIIILP